MERTPVLALDDVEALITDLEVSYTELKELNPAVTEATSNNSCCHGSCYTF